MIFVTVIVSKEQWFLETILKKSVANATANGTVTKSNATFEVSYSENCTAMLLDIITGMFVYPLRF